MPQINIRSSQDNSLLLIPGRVLSIEGTEIETNPLTNKNRVIFDKVLTISTDDASSLSLNNGDNVTISSNTNSITAKVKIDRHWYNGFVACTDLFAEYMTQLEEDDAFNPMLKPGKLNYQTVSINKIN